MDDGDQYDWPNTEDEPDMFHEKLELYRRNTIPNWFREPDNVPPIGNEQYLDSR